MNKEFRVDCVINQGRQALVLATQFDQRDFKISETSLLSGVAIHPILSQPRKLKKDGSVDYDTFVFTLKFQADKERFQAGDVVELVEENEPEPVDANN